MAGLIKRIGIPFVSLLPLPLLSPYLSYTPSLYSSSSLVIQRFKKRDLLMPVIDTKSTSNPSKPNGAAKATEKAAPELDGTPVAVNCKEVSVKTTVDPQSITKVVQADLSLCTF